MFSGQGTIVPPWRRQHLDRRAATVEEVVSAVVGIQTTHETGPPLALAARLPNFKRSMLRESLWHGRLVWMSAMRGSKFVLPAHLVGAAIAAFAALAEQSTWRGLDSMGLKRRDVERAIPRVQAVLEAAEGPMTSRDIEREASQEAARSALFILAARGEVVRAGKRGSYLLRSRWLPDLGQLPSVTTATGIFVSAYLRTYGPVTVRDAAWWTGLPKRAVEAALEEVGRQGTGGYWTAPDQPPDTTPAAHSLRLLPALDPLTMGWRDRGRLIDPSDDELVYNRQGGSYPTILWAGRVVGRWTWDRRVETSSRFKGSKSDVVAEIDRLARVLGRRPSTRRFA